MCVPTSALLVAYCDIFQAGFAAKETVTIIGSKAGRALNNVRVLGPPRGATQLELAYTDALQVGIKAPVRISGNTAGMAIG